MMGLKSQKIEIMIKSRNYGSHNNYEMKRRNSEIKTSSEILHFSAGKADRMSW